MSVKMSVNIIKCASCNVVISEVLAFIRNKHDVMDNESLIRICESAFSEEDLDKAKKLLFTSVKTKQKCVSRRKQKKQKDLEDIIAVFKTVDPEQIPVFVAYDPHKLPPICFDHVDVTKILKDLLILQAEVKQIKNNYVTTDLLEEMKHNFQTIRSPLSFCNDDNINTRRGGYSGDSGPIGLPYVTSELTADTDVTSPAKDNNNATEVVTSAAATAEHGRSDSNHNNDVTKKLTYRSLFRSRANNNIQNNAVPVTLASSPLLGCTTTNNGNELVSKNQPQAFVGNSMLKKDTCIENRHSDGWTLVQPRKPLNRFMGKTGKAVSSPLGKFKAAETKIPLLISNVNKQTTEHDICEYIKSKTQELVHLEKIIMKKEKPYNAFKLFVSKSKLQVYLNDNLWPEGITFRRFIFFKKQQARDNSLIMHDTSK